MNLSNILLIDNNKQAKKILETSLKVINPSLKIHLCRSNKEIEKVLFQKKIDLVLLHIETDWINVYDAVEYLSSVKPYISRIVFSNSFIDLSNTERKLKADSFIHNLSSNRNNLQHAFEFGIERANERKQYSQMNDEFKEIFDNVHIGLYKLDMTGKILTCNTTFANFLGYNDRDDVKGLNLRDFIIKIQHNYKVLSDLNISTYISPYIQGKAKIRRNDDTELTVEIDTKPIYNKEKILLHLYGSVRDISDEINLQKEVSESQNKMELYLDSADAFFVVVDKDGKIVTINSKLAKFHGLKKEEMIGKKWIDIAVEELRKENYNFALKESLAGRIDKYRYVKAESTNSNGQKHVILWKNTDIKDDKKDVVAIISSGTDITEMVKSQVALKNSEELYRRIFENTGSSMIVLDLDYSIIICNSELEKLIGYSKKEIEGKKWLSFIHINDQEFLKNIASERLSNPENFPRNINFRLYTKNNYVRSVWAIIDAIPGSNRTVVSIHDITDKMILQEAREILFQQIQSNIEQFAILVDSIRNPLSIITALLDIENYTKKVEILEQIKYIDDIILQLDQSWLVSVNVRNFLNTEFL